MPKTKEKSIPFPVYPIENWSVLKYGVKKLYINPDWGIRYGPEVTLDVEDDEHGNFVGIGVYDPKLNVCYYWSEKTIQWQLPSRFIAHNGVSDLRKLQAWGYPYTDDALIWDTMLMAHILDSSRHQYGLKKLVKEEFGYDYPSYDDIVGKRTLKQIKPRVTLDKQPLEIVSNYNACDAYFTWALYKKQKEQCEKDLENGEKAVNRESRISDSNPETINYHNQIELPASFVFHAMQDKGIRIDLEYLRQFKDTLEAQRTPLEASIKAELGEINLSSGPQLLKALKAKGIEPIFKKKPSTDKRGTLYSKFGHIQAVKQLAEYNELDSLLSGFVYPYLVRNQEIIHPQFKQTGTRTGRPSCADPNLLNIPRRTDNGKLVRKMFIARPGHLFGCCDYKEGEPRMLAELSQDPSMLALFNEGRGFHSYFAEHLNISRDKAKVFDLETYYRATKYGVARHLNCGLSEAQTRIDEAWNLFPTLHDWEEKTIYEAKKDGYITTLMGRRIKIEGLDSQNSWIREAAERQAMNNIAQGSLQEITKKALIEISKCRIDLLLEVYDDVLFESPEECVSSDMEIVVDKMEHTCILSIPMIVDGGISNNWAECK